MYTRITTVVNRSGLHARPAAQLVEAAKSFQSRITARNLSVADEDSAANVKSIISILALGLGQGTEIELSATGEDENNAVDTLVSLIESGFGE